MQSIRQRLPSWEVLWSEVWNLFKFGVVGVSSMLLNTAIYALFTRIVWPSGSRTLLSVIATMFAAIYNFLLHRGWTFKTRAFNAAILHRQIHDIFGADGIGVQRLHTELIKSPWTCRCGKMVDLLNALKLQLKPCQFRKRIQIKRRVDVVADKLEVRVLQQEVDVGFRR
jgi:hypothetical protein